MKILAVLCAVAILLGSFLLPAQKAEAISLLYMSYYGDGTTTAAVTVSDSIYRGFSFTPTQNIHLTSIGFDMNDLSHTGTVTCRIYLGDANHKPTGSVLAQTTKALADLDGYATTQATYAEYDYFIFTTPYTLIDNTEYVALIVGDTQTAGLLVDQDTLDTDTDYVYTTNSGSSYTTGDNYIGFFLYGLVTTEFQVVTLSANYNTNQDFELRGNLNSLGGYVSANCYFEYGLDTGYGSETEVQVLKADGLNGKFSQIMNGFPDGSVIHYRAVAEAGNQVDYGADVSFTVESVPKIEVSAAYDITFDAAKVDVIVYGIGEDTTGALSLQYSTTTTLDDDPDYEIDATCTGPEQYTVEFSSLTDSTKYYYRVYFNGTEHDIYTAPRSFQTYNPDKPDMLNDWDKFFSGIGFGGDGPWWVIMLILFLIVLGLAIYMRKTWVVLPGIVLILGIGIATGVIDIWLVVLLTIVTGFIGWKMVFNRSEG